MSQLIDAQAQAGLNELATETERLLRKGTGSGSTRSATSSTTSNSAEPVGVEPNGHKIKLKGPSGAIVFEASSPVQEDRQATYQGFNIVHLPTSLHSYHSTTGRKFSITGKLVSRTPGEASANSRYLDLARFWILPDFGNTGATPPILKLTAYNNNNISNLQTILTSYSWSFPEEVDYIWAGTSPMPIIGNLTLNLEEIYSAEQITAGTWRINVGSGGLFNREQEGPNWASSIKGSLATSGSRFLASLGGALMTAKGIPGQTGPSVIPTIPGVLAGRLTRNLGTQLLNSPAVRELTKQLPPVVSNIFITGSNVVVGQLGKIATTVVSAATQPAPPPFNRATPLANIGFVGPQ